MAMTEVTQQHRKADTNPQTRENWLKCILPRVSHILDEIRLSLDKQDSDGALMAIIKWALELRASDIHLELQEVDAEIRFRIDGDLATVGTLQAKEHALIVERMKYKSNLKLNIHDVPQDGKFRFGKEGHDAQIDIRVSVMPTRYGESIVCRILDSSSNVINFDGLGIIGPQKEIILTTLKKKQGMILVTGPTGSGKTTTLYTMIDTLKQPEDKIITLEDPIEYQIPGVLQSEINERAGYTFAMGVRRSSVTIQTSSWLVKSVTSILRIPLFRQLSQVILCSRRFIRRVHLRHSNDLRIWELVHLMLLRRSMSSSLSDSSAESVVTVQRERQYHTTSWRWETLRSLWCLLNLSHREENGCDQCGHTGYSGRMGIYEVFQMTDEIREAIRTGKNDTEIKTSCLKWGFLSILDKMHEQSLTRYDDSGRMREKWYSVDIVYKILFLLDNLFFVILYSESIRLEKP
jgi:type II secretory ATPase GspE/PulE/Tfp pilus assembly ATPase PilB-like protein